MRSREPFVWGWQGLENVWLTFTIFIEFLESGTGKFFALVSEDFFWKTELLKNLWVMILALCSGRG